MILQRIFTKELKQKLSTNKQKLEALENIKKYINKIDHSFEVVSTGDLSKLHSLFVDLKESELSKEEVMMVKEVFEISIQ